MGVSVEEKEIGGSTYRVTQLGFKQSRKMWVRLTHIFGAAAKEILTGLDAAGADVSMAAIGSSLEAVLLNMEDEDLDHACTVFGACTEVRVAGGEYTSLSLVMDELFAGDLPGMFAWLGFCLKVNYSGFLDGNGALGSLFQTFRAKSPNPSPKE